MRASGDIFGSVRLYFGVVLSIFLVSSARVSGGKHPVRLEDIVIAYPADDRHVVVAKASRVWRKVNLLLLCSAFFPSSQLLELSCVPA